MVDAAGIATSAVAFGLVYGLAARASGFSLLEVLAMSVFVLAGAAQFAAIGLVASGVPWTAIVLLTALLNARHVLYSMALAPWLTRHRRVERAAMAHVLTDEAFGLSLPHFRRLGRADVPGYWLAALTVVVAWIGANLIGFAGGQGIPDPTRLGLDIVFPAAMAGLAAGMITGRREVVAASTGAVVAVIGSLALSPSVGIVAGGLLGPLAGLTVRRTHPTSDSELAEEFAFGPLPHERVAGFSQDPPDERL